MTAWIDRVVGFAAANPALAYTIIILAVLLEAVPVAGSLVPGSTLLLAMSALIPGGELHAGPVLAGAVGAALFGDGAAFWIGHRAQHRILETGPLARYPAMVARSEEFFRRHGTLAVFFARFLAPVRALVPVTAGALGMAPARFYSVNAAAVMLWALAHVLPGMLAITALHRYGDFAHPGQIARRYWIPLTLAAGIIAALALWWRQRRRNGATGRTSEPP